MVNKNNFDFEDSPQASILAPAVDETQLGLLSCNVSSNPESTITLYRLVNGAEQIVDGTVSGRNVLRYTIDNASREDAGTYRCKTNNQFGRDDQNTRLIVRCKFNSLK